MARSIDRNFYKSKQWKTTSKAYLNSVNGLCEICLAQGLLIPAKIVHHKVHLNRTNVNDPTIALGWSNLQAVCQDCHNKIHFAHEDKRYRFIDGEMIIDDRAEAPYND